MTSWMSPTCRRTALSVRYSTAWPRRSRASCARPSSPAGRGRLGRDLVPVSLQEAQGGYRLVGFLAAPLIDGLLRSKACWCFWIPREYRPPSQPPKPAVIPAATTVPNGASHSQANGFSKGERADASRE